MSKAEDCPLKHSYISLSYTTAILCFILFVSTSTLNSLIVYIIYHNRRKKFTNLFYKLLLNIAVSDALVGFVADTCFVAIHISEGRNSGLKPHEAMAAHTIMFTLGGVALLTLVFLCVDRIYAILRPHSYRRGLSRTSVILLVASAWCLSIVLVPVYFVLGFMKYLIIFTSFNILLPFIFLILTAVIYQKRLVVQGHKEDVSQSSSSETATLKSRAKGCARRGQKTTKTFLKMLLVFIFSYLPASFITIYFSLCTLCNCRIINILRDISVLFILSGSLLRSLNFLLSLESLKKEVRYIFSKNNGDDTSSGSAGT